MRSGDMAMPEERTRIEVDSIADLLLCPDERSRGILEWEGVPGTIAVVGDVMADACFTFAPIARERSEVLERLGLEPGTYVVATIHRDANVVAAPPRPHHRRTGRDRRSGDLSGPPANPRCTSGTGTVPGTCPFGRAALVPRLRGSGVAGTRDRDGLGRAAERGVLVRRPVCDYEAVHGVGRHRRAGSEHARRRRSRTARHRRRRPALTLACRSSGPVWGREGSAEDRRSSLYPSRPMTEPKLEAQPAEPTTRHWDVAIVGAGYVGVPLARLLAQSGKSVLLVDVAEQVVAGINRGESHIEDVASAELGPLVQRAASRRLPTTTRFATPTRLSSPCPRRSRSSASRTSRFSSTPSRASPSAYGRPARGARVDDLPRHYARGRPADPRGERPRGGRDFQLAFSPERVDPGNTRWRPQTSRRSSAASPTLYRARGRALPGRDRPGAPRLLAGGRRADEAAREHLPLGQHRARQRARAALRPDGHRRLGGRRRGGYEAVRLHAFEPGPGLGGHCIPIDPFYLTWKAREYGFYTEFIELAGKVNENMPYYCRSLISQALNHGRQRSLKGSKILVLGVAYKPDISTRASRPP